jgi:transposase
MTQAVFCHFRLTAVEAERDIFANDMKRRYHRCSEAERVEVIAMRQTGNSFQSISDTMKIPSRTANAIIAKWNQHHTVKDLPKSGRPAKLDARMRRHLVRMVQIDEIATGTELAHTASTQLQVPITAHTARNMMHEEGLHARHTISKPLLSRTHKRLRLELAQNRQHWTVDDWKQVIFSDEALITAYAVNPHSTVWTRDTKGLNPRLVVPAVQGGGSRIMVWGCISKFGFHDLALLEGHVNSEAYITTLTDHLLPVIDTYFRDQAVVFQQDGARIHTSHATMEFLESSGVRVLEWPPNSPDLNLIEHVWHMLKSEIHKLESATSVTKLWENTMQTMNVMWAQEMTDKITRLYESMPRRIIAIIDACGGNTKY